MPPGRMSWHQDYRTQLQGFNRNTCPFVIVIQYSFQSGYLPDGTRYSGTSRTSFLPGTPEGIECLGLLILSFQRKLTFLVGTSITTGRTNCVVWAGIHHKTSPSGGTSSFGWPDETYFARVKGELGDRGVTPAEIAKPVPLQGQLQSQ